MEEHSAREPTDVEEVRADFEHWKRRVSLLCYTGRHSLCSGIDCTDSCHLKAQVANTMALDNEVVLDYNNASLGKHLALPLRDGYCAYCHARVAAPFEVKVLMDLTDADGMHRRGQISFCSRACEQSAASEEGFLRA